MATYITLTGTYHLPTGDEAAGKVRFTLVPAVTESPDGPMVESSITVTLDTAGAFAVPLLANTDPTVAPAGSYYLVQEWIAEAEREYTIIVPHALGSPLNLAALAPAIPGPAQAAYVLQSTYAMHVATVASTSGLGHVKVDGTSTTVDPDGTLHSAGGGVPAGQSLAYSATITPDPALGAVVLVGALTGNLAVANPASASIGQSLILQFTQDSTGGRTVAWGTAFAGAPAAINPAPGDITTLGFIYDGTAWRYGAAPPAGHLEISPWSGTTEISDATGRPRLIVGGAVGETNLALATMVVGNDDPAYALTGLLLYSGTREGISAQSYSGNAMAGFSFTGSGMIGSAQGDGAGVYGTNYGSGPALESAGYFRIDDSSEPPTPTGGIVQWSAAGVLHWKGPDGVVH